MGCIVIIVQHDHEDRRLNRFKDSLVGIRQRDKMISGLSWVKQIVNKLKARTKLISTEQTLAHTSLF